MLWKSTIVQITPPAVDVTHSQPKRGSSVIFWLGTEALDLDGDDFHPGSHKSWRLLALASKRSILSR